MIYCNLSEIKYNTAENVFSAEYNFGTTVDNITGKVVFYADNTMPEIIEHPRLENVPMPHIMKLYTKYRKKFLAANFPERISYEC